MAAREIKRSDGMENILKFVGDEVVWSLGNFTHNLGLSIISAKEYHSEVFMIRNQAAKLILFLVPGSLVPRSLYGALNLYINFDPYGYKIDCRFTSGDRLLQCDNTENANNFSGLLSTYNLCSINKLTISVKINEIKEQKSEFLPYLNNDTFSDIEIKVGDEIFKCHKLVLVSRSEWFKELDNKTSNVVIEESDIKIFKYLIKFMYTDVCDFSDSRTLNGAKYVKVVNDELLMQILLAAKKYGIKTLENKILEIYKKTLDIKNIEDRFLQTKKSVDFQELHNLAKNYIGMMPLELKTCQFTSKCLGIPLEDLELFYTIKHNTAK